jgi:mRNA interferase MazF
MKRNEVRWVLFEPPDKRRPAVILTRNSAFGYLSTVTVAPITSIIRETLSSVRLGLEDGLPEVCNANLHNVLTVGQTRVRGLLTVLGEGKMTQIEAALLFALGMERYAR